MAITLKGRTINLKPKNIMATNPVQPMVAPLSTTQQQSPVANQPYTPGTSIDGRSVQTNTGNPYIAYSQRAKPTVATAQQPVISKTTNNSLIYDPNDPEDYLMKLQARGVTGKTPTEQEYYQALQAQKALQARQTNSANPLQSQMDELIRQQQEQRGLESGRDTNELDAYIKQLDQQYGVQRDELLASGDRQRSAAQNVYSFSGFGRSTAAANKMTEIQKGIDGSISSLNAAKEAAIAAKKAELEGADSETLSALNSRVQQYQDAANKRQMDSLQQTAQANQTSGASYIESLNNLMATASKNGMDIGNPEDIQIYAQMARNPDGSINEEFVGALPEGMQAIIRTANIQQSKEAPKIENFGTTKSPRYMQRDGAKRAPVSGAGGGAMGGGGSGGVRSGGGASGGGMGGAGVGATGDSVLQEGNATDLIDYNVRFKNQGQADAFGYATRMIEASDVFNKNEGYISGLSKGELIKQNIAGELPYGSSLQSEEIQSQRQAEQNFINAILRKESGAAIGKSEYSNAQRQYFPQPGDSANTLEQKRKNRLTAIKGISAATANQKALSPAINKISQPQVTNTQPPAAQQKPKATTGAGRWVKK